MVFMQYTREPETRGQDADTDPDPTGFSYLVGFASCFFLIYICFVFSWGLCFDPVFSGGSDPDPESEHVATRYAKVLILMSIFFKNNI